MTLNSKLRALTGEELKGSKTFGVISEPLKLWSFFPGDPEQPMPSSDVPLEAARRMTLVFNAEVDPATIRQFIQGTTDTGIMDFKAMGPNVRKLKNASRQPWFKADYSIEELPKHMLTLAIKLRMKEQTKVNVAIAKGAYGKKDKHRYSRKSTRAIQL